MLITVITVTLNCKGLVGKTIDSVLSQTYKTVEYIIVDGGSNDGTVSLIQRYGSKITGFVSEKDHGIYDAMNKGIANASKESKLVCFLNAGDVFSDENVIKDVVENVPDESSHIYGDFLKDNKVVWTPEKIGKYFLSTNMICHQAIFFNTTIHKNNLYDTRYKICADYKLLLDMIMSGDDFKKIDRLIVKYDTGGVSNLYREKLHSEKIKIRKLYPTIYILHFIKTKLILLKNQLGRSE